MYNFKGNKAIYCSLHKKEGMIDVHHKKCIFDGCNKIPTCNFEGEIKGIYCFEHKVDKMINVKDKRCIYEGCNTQSSFNYEGLKEKLYCSKHKKDGMVSVKAKKCADETCKKTPGFNYHGEDNAIYCSTHKKDGMIDITHKKCRYENCQYIPTYNFENETRPIYCSLHKKDKMVNVKHKKCIFDGCKKIPNYNFEGEKRGIYCFEHKKDNMINVIEKRCIYDGCKITACFNNEGETKPIYCASHKKDGMIDIRSKKCKNTWCYTRPSNNKYEGYCFNCYLNMFPDKPVSRNYKTKEYAVIEYVKNKFPNFTWICDKIIKVGCSKKRPDLLLDFGYQVLIIEIDENQHINYDCSCENKRIMELSLDLQHRPIIFIRFNPDEYNKDNKITSSCWGIDGRGMCTIKKTKQNEWNDRLNALSSQIEYWLNPENVTDKTVEVIQLFYDE
jgi:hypothetical protein